MFRRDLGCLPAGFCGRLQGMIHDALWDRLAALEPDTVCVRALVERDKATGAFILPVLNHRYIVDPARRLVARDGAPADSEPPVYPLPMLAVNYLIGAREVPLAREWVTPGQLPGGETFFRGSHAMPDTKLIARFGTDATGFKAAGAALGGVSCEHGDAAVELPLLPRLPVTVVLWLADDEFDARVSFMFDRTACAHLQLDALLAAAQFAQKEFVSV